MSGMPPLYIITEEYQELLWALSSPEEEELSQEELESILKEVSDLFDKKAANIAGLFLNLEAQAKAIKEAEQRMKKRRDSLEKNSKRLRDYLLNSMQSLSIKEVKTPEYLVKIRKNPCRVDVANEALIPQRFKEVVESVKINKTAIKEAIRSGNQVPGATLEQGYSLAVR